LPCEIELLLIREDTIIMYRKEGLESFLFIQGVWRLLDEQNGGRRKMFITRANGGKLI
jgi:hypothetical protein